MEERPGRARPAGQMAERLKIKDSNIDTAESDYDGDGKKNDDEPAPGNNAQERESNTKKNMFNPAVN